MKDNENKELEDLIESISKSISDTGANLLVLQRNIEGLKEFLIETPDKELKLGQANKQLATYLTLFEQIKQRFDKINKYNLRH